MNIFRGEIVSPPVWESYTRVSPVSGAELAIPSGISRGERIDGLICGVE